MPETSASRSPSTARSLSRGRSDGDDVFGLCEVNRAAPGTPAEGNHAGDPGSPRDSPKSDVISKWRAAMQAGIDAKRKAEADALEAATKKAQEQLEDWRKVRREKLAAKVVETKEKAKCDPSKSLSGPVDWQKVAALLTKSGYSANDQNGGASQKMVDLIFTKAKE